VIVERDNIEKYNTKHIGVVIVERDNIEKYNIHQPKRNKNNH
jgi:hypothetical protein